MIAATRESLGAATKTQHSQKKKKNLKNKQKKSRHCLSSEELVQRSRNGERGPGEEILQLGRKFFPTLQSLPNSLRSVYNTRFTKEETLRPLHPWPSQVTVTFKVPLRWSRALGFLPTSHISHCASNPKSGVPMGRSG